MSALPVAESVLSARSGRTARPGDTVVCEPDLVLGTDGSVPMAIETFEAMGGGPVSRPERILFARDHYAPPTSPSTLGFHARMQSFADRHGVTILPVGGGISFLHALEHDRVGPGDLVVGGDSHTVTCGVAGAFAVGVGSSDLAGAFRTGKVWLRVPETIRVLLDGELPTGVEARDVALTLVRECAGRLGPFTALEFTGPAVRAMDPEQRLVIANMAAEMGAMAGVFVPEGPRLTDVREITVDVRALEPLVALPHDPGQGVPVSEAEGRPVDWVFLGTCAGGGVRGFREALRVLRAGGGLSSTVTLVVTPPTPSVRRQLLRDGILQELEELGAVVTETGCGPCCGTSGPIPPPGATVLSTANRNYRGRMGQRSAQILLASAATCGAAAAAGKIVDPRRIA